MNIDLGFGNRDKEIPLYGRKSISILLGAGFSAPMGYPIGNAMNKGLLNFDDSKVDFTPDGTLAISKDGTKPKFQMDGVLNIHPLVSRKNWDEVNINQIVPQRGDNRVL